MPDRVLLEVCIDSVESAVAAQEGGADRVELCTALFEGGLTPSAGLIETVRERVKIAVAVMIRPRGGDFCYDATEAKVMERDIRLAKSLGADVIVLGSLSPDGSVDREQTRRLMEVARPLPVTFHRAFDMARDPYEALDAVLELGAERLLTSGQEKSAAEGMDLIAELVKRCGDRLIVMPGGGVTERNLKKILTQTGAREIHGSASGGKDSRMTYRNGRVFMGGQMGPPEYATKVANLDRVRAFRSLAG
ncbi:MAG: copper homeostasis protein CutC [Verrucomicrobiales bacterium]|nr:copper homeostasis protein CutC [Verrucomicrobiales bacterium]